MRKQRKEKNKCGISASCFVNVFGPSAFKAQNCYHSPNDVCSHHGATDRCTLRLTACTKPWQLLTNTSTVTPLLSNLGKISPQPLVTAVALTLLALHVLKPVCTSKNPKNNYHMITGRLVGDPLTCGTCWGQCLLCPAGKPTHPSRSSVRAL